MTGHPQKNLGRLIGERRVDFGASLEQVAGWARLPTARVREIEEGATLAPAEFQGLSSALAVSPEALFNGLTGEPRRGFARFRTASANVDLTPSDLRLLALAAEVGRVGGGLLSLLGDGYALSEHREPVPLKDRPQPWKQGYLLGEQARHRLGVPAAPIQDLEAFLNRVGVHVARGTFDSPDIDAASLWEPGAIPVILLNLGSPRTRRASSRRAVLAHELGHVLHDTGEADLTTRISWSEKTGNWSEAVEQRARGFAPGFLAPRDITRHWLKSAHPRLRSPSSIVGAIAKYWGLSLIGAAWHAKNAQLVTARAADDLVGGGFPREQPWVVDFEGAREPDEPATWPGDSPQTRASTLVSGLVSVLAYRAAESGSISQARRRELDEYGL